MLVLYDLFIISRIVSFCQETQLMLSQIRAFFSQLPSLFFEAKVAFKIQDQAFIFSIHVL